MSSALRFDKNQNFPTVLVTRQTPLHQRVRYEVVLRRTSNQDSIRKPFRKNSLYFTKVTPIFQTSDSLFSNSGREQNASSPSPEMTSTTVGLVLQVEKVRKGRTEGTRVKHIWLINLHQNRSRKKDTNKRNPCFLNDPKLQHTGEAITEATRLT